MFYDDETSQNTLQARGECFTEACVYTMEENILMPFN